MSVMFTAEAEKRRQRLLQEGRARKSTRYELLITTNIVQALHYARDHGWGENKVQVKAYRRESDTFEYAVEPYEDDCRCPNLLRFADYFDEATNAV